MELSSEGGAFIGKEEGVSASWYKDALGTWTIGIGHVWNPATDQDFEYRDLTQAEIWELFEKDVARYVAAVNAGVTVTLTQTQFDRLVSFAFNWGISPSTGFPATSVVRLINAGDFAAAAADLVDGKGPGGRPYDKALAGVRARRIREAEPFKTTGGPMSELWHPRARRAPANRDGGTFIDVPPKIVLHTVEGRGRYSYNPANYYGNPYWPHATIDVDAIHQHLPIDVYGFALANSAGGAETNRAHAIQCEVLWFAAEIAELPDELLANLADWVGWVAKQTGTPLVFAEFRGDGSYGEGAPQRFSADEWLDFTGVCGHQHVPENDHWDPGAFPVDRLRPLLGGVPPAPPTPVPEEDTAMRLIGVTNNRGIFLVGTQPLTTVKGKGRVPAVYIATPEEVTALVDSRVAVRDEEAPDLPEAVFNRRFVVVG